MAWTRVGADPSDGARGQRATGRRLPPAALSARWPRPSTDESDDLDRRGRIRASQGRCLPNPPSPGAVGRRNVAPAGRTPDGEPAGRPATLPYAPGDPRRAAPSRRALTSPLISSAGPLAARAGRAAALVRGRARQARCRRRWCAAPPTRARRAAAAARPAARPAAEQLRIQIDGVAERQQSLLV
jgi:hypothetical protein